MAEKRHLQQRKKAKQTGQFFTSGNELVSEKKTSSSQSSQTNQGSTKDSSQSVPQKSFQKKSSSKKSSQPEVPKQQSSQSSSAKPSSASGKSKSSQAKSKKSSAKKTDEDSSQQKNKKVINNYAFIDGQNLNKAIQSQGWSLDYKEFRKYLREKYNVTKAYIFIGLITTNQTLYSALQDFGYHLVFKPTIANKFGEVKGNVDAEMVLYAITLMPQYDKAVIVSGDGDFYSIVQYLQNKGQLEKLLVPNDKAYSALYDTLDIDTSFVTNLRKKLEYNKHK